MVRYEKFRGRGREARNVSFYFCDMRPGQWAKVSILLLSS